MALCSTESHGKLGNVIFPFQQMICLGKQRNILKKLYKIVTIMIYILELIQMSKNDRILPRIIVYLRKVLWVFVISQSQIYK